MAKLYILSVVAGLVATLGVPYFVKGVMGKGLDTMLGKTSAVANAALGWFFLAVSVLVLHFAHPRLHEYRAAVLFAAGVLVMAVVLALVMPGKSSAKK